jgi:hypothetical protein
MTLLCYDVHYDCKTNGILLVSAMPDSIFVTCALQTCNTNLPVTVVPLWLSSVVKKQRYDEGVGECLLSQAPLQLVTGGEEVSFSVTSI